MTVEIGGQIVGLGGKPYSMARTLVKMATDPGDAMLHARRFFRGQAAPLTSGVWDIATGANYLGEPVEGWQAVASEGVASRFMPFWLDAQINDSPKPSGLGFAADVFGARSWPLSPEDSLREVKDELAAQIPKKWLDTTQITRMDEEGLLEPTWEMLSAVQKHRITRDGEVPSGADPAIIKVLQEHWAKYEDVVKKRKATKPANRAVTAYQESREDAKTQWEEGARSLQAGVEANAASPRDFLKYMKNVNTAYGTRMKDVNKADGLHEEALLQFRKWEADGNREFIPIADQAMDDYITTLVAADFTNEWGMFDYSKREKAEAQLRSRWPDEEGGVNVIDAIEADFKRGKDTPVLWKRWMRDRDVLKEYWRLHNDYLLRNPEVRMHGVLVERAVNSRNIKEEQRLKRHPLYRKMDRELDRKKKELRRSDPFLDATLYYWGYASTLLSSEAYEISNAGLIGTL